MTNRNWAKPQREKLITERGTVGVYGAFTSGRLGYGSDGIRHPVLPDPTATKVQCACGRKYRAGKPVKCACGKKVVQP